MSTEHVFNALQEGEVMGCIRAIEFYKPNVSRREIAAELRKLFSSTHKPDHIEYWIDWFKLEPKPIPLTDQQLDEFESDVHKHLGEFDWEYYREVILKLIGEVRRLKVVNKIG